jgi:preprotein translocase subunit SecA
LHHIEEALKAKTLFQKDIHYVVKDGEVIIVDEFTGRLMPGRRYSEGLHQAIEAKEGVTIQQESQTLATISFQNYFRMYEKLSGMTGTAATEAEEFHKIYKLGVVIIPTNKDITRKDHPDAIYKTQTAKYNAVASEIEKVHASGQPILIGTTSIEKNEFLSDLLKRKKISHALLNAKNHEREAEIIADAGKKGSVTVATNLAGRGVDIKLGKDVDKLGGLYVMGTERHESRRIDNQLRGRSGRQGDPGATKFFVSLEDDLMRIFGGEQVTKVMDFLKMPEEMPIENSMVSRAIEGAQKKVEGHNFDARKYTVEYDDVMNQQRQIIYGVRKQILETADGQTSRQLDTQTVRQKDDLMSNSEAVSESQTLKEEILAKVDKEISAIVMVHSIDIIDHSKIVEEFSGVIPFDTNSKKGLETQLSELHDGEQISEFLSKLARDLYEEREKQLGGEISRQMESFVYLNTIDTLWIEHLDTIDDLRSGINLRAYAQRDPLVEYKREAFDLFEKLMVTIDAEVARRIFKVAVEHQHNHPIQVAPLVDLEKVTEKHEEALDETALLEEVGQLITPSSDTSAIQSDGETKVTIERNGEVKTEVYGATGAIQKTHGKLGRNDPCWCASGKKYKRCHYPN